MEDFFDAAGPADLLAGLNSQQQQAVQIVDGPLMILAGPGSGKTRVVTHRIAHMIQQGIGPQQIVALTFTNKAADELKQRIARLVPGNYVWTGTFHRFCSRLLRQYAPLIGLSESFTIFDMDDAGKALAEAWDRADIDDQFVTRPAVQNEISKAKNAVILPDEYQARPGKPVGAVVEKIYPLYQKLLLENNAVDFDDLLLWTAVLLQQNEDLRQSLDQKFAYIMVDEYQDTNLAQYAIVRALSNDAPNLAVTGDPDQSIYGWRGANIQNILGFERDYPDVQVVRLEQNYRSTKSILSVADELISHNTQRKAKRLLTDNDQGDSVRVMVFPSPQEEAEYIANEIARAIEDGIWEPRDIAIFYRANWLSRQLEHAFNGLGIPFQLINGFEFYQRKEIKDVIAYLRLVANPRNDIALERIINSPSRKIGKVTIQRLKADAQQHGISLWEACRRSGLNERLPKRSATAVARFVAQLDQLSATATNSIQQWVQSVLRITGYRHALEIEDSEQAEEKLANLDELVSAAREFDNQHPEDGDLETYLETAALVSDTDKLVDADRAVKMMTIHAAKGLEFPSVYVVGLEEGIMPHERSKESPAQIEEERRLLFVALTRAQTQLTLCRCESRIKRGQFWMSPPSSFLMDLPREELDEYDRSRARRAVDNDWHTEPDSDSWVDEYCGGTSFAIDETTSELSEDDDAEMKPSFDFGANRDPEDTGEESPASNTPPRSDKRSSRNPSANQASTGRRSLPKVTTAAQMLSGDLSNAGNDQNLAEGDLVQHPEYGIGNVLSINGPGKKQKVIVHFVSGDRKNFVVRFAKLTKLASRSQR